MDTHIPFSPSKLDLQLALKDEEQQHTVFTSFCNFTYIFEITTALKKFDFLISRKSRLFEKKTKHESKHKKYCPNAAKN